MQRPLLTIAIPTLNRLELLKVSINAFLEQLSPEHIGEVEFLVMNNASEDGTDKWLNDSFTDHPILKYRNFPERVSAVPSIVRCIEGASGEYMWIFGDDDLPMPFAVATILSLLKANKNNDLGIIHFNGLLTGTNFIRYSRIYNYKLHSTSLAMSLDDFVNEFHILLGLIIVLVFKRDNWLQAKSFYRECYYGYDFLGPMLAGSKGHTCLYYPFPLVIQRIGFQNYTNKWPLFFLVGLPNIFDDLNQEKIINSNPILNWQNSYSNLDLIKVLIVAKAFNYKANHFMWDDAMRYQRSDRKNLVRLFRYLFPTWLAKIIFNLGASVKGANEQ